jgi:hypothetical protein
MKRFQTKAKELKEVSGIWNGLTAKTARGEFGLRPGEADVQSSRGSNGKGCQTGSISTGRTNEGGITDQVQSEEGHDN